MNCCKKNPIRAAQNKQRGRQFDMPELRVPPNILITKEGSPEQLVNTKLVNEVKILTKNWSINEEFNYMYPLFAMSYYCSNIFYFLRNSQNVKYWQNLYYLFLNEN